MANNELKETDGNTEEVQIPPKADELNDFFQGLINKKR